MSERVKWGINRKVMSFTGFSWRDRLEMLRVFLDKRWKSQCINKLVLDFLPTNHFSFLEDKWSYSQNWYSLHSDDHKVIVRWIFPLRQFDVPLNGDRSWILGLIETCQRLFVKEKMEQSVTILWIYVSCSTLRPLSISCFLLVIHPPSQKGFTFGGPRNISFSHISKELWSSDSLSGLPAAAANVPAAGAGVASGYEGFRKWMGFLLPVSRENLFLSRL